ncbi:alpha/beta hydrolase, partial [Pseudomonas viridiflava]|uniref:alpha/beta hydrolase n=1 Tax=Pseudomonas viridiflava TaxID=33069 RepID=UPI000F06C64C
ESPFFDWMASNPDDHVLIKNGRRLDREQFNQSLALRLGESGASLMFIHGYNVTFEDSVKRTAQLAYDLQFKGAPLLFSWPSSGDESQYRADESAIERSYPAIYDFLKNHLENPSVKKVYIVAHGM